jgi:hypothetical protein
VITVVFNGHILPKDGLQMNITGATLQWSDENVRARIKYSIAGQAVSCSCELESEADLETLNVLHLVVFHRIRGLIDAVAFSAGCGVMLVIDECVHPDGARVPIFLRGSILSQLCTVPLQRVIDLVEQEPRISKPLHDLIESINDFMDAPLSCQRAIEGIARLVSSHSDRKKRWLALRDNLNLSQPYLQFVTDLSVDPRHGHAGEQSIGQLNEARRRAWIVADRFLHFRDKGNDKLPVSEFPLL